MFLVCLTVLSVHCSLVFTCCERANLLALLYVNVFFFVTLPRGVLDQVWYLIVMIPDICFLPYFYKLLFVCKSRGKNGMVVVSSCPCRLKHSVYLYSFGNFSEL